MVIFLEGSPIFTVELWSSVRVTIGFLVSSLIMALLSRLLRRLALGQVLVVSNYFHLKMNEATVFLGTFSAAGIFWYPKNVSVQYHLAFK